MFHFLFFKFVNAELFEIEIFVIKTHPFAHLVLMGPLAHLVLIGPSVPLAPTQLLPSLTPLASTSEQTYSAIWCMGRTRAAWHFLNCMGGHTRMRTHTGLQGQIPTIFF